MITRFLSSLFFLAAVNTGIAQAQVVPDGTLPTVVEQLENMRKITGGERSGNNLFHSFQEFSVPEGIEAIFENGLDIENIFTRITGNNISIIDGLLKTAGGANFFLINPNGIVFGENAQLDVGGSFIATTASRIKFADGTSFAAAPDNPKVTLTISVPIGLNFDGNNGSITVNGSGNQIINDSSFSPIEFSQVPSGLAVNNEGTLALVANGIEFNSGVVTTSGGNIYLNSLESGEVGISQAEKGLSLIDRDVNRYQDINFERQSLVDAGGEKVGAISVIGKNINLNDASFILSQNQSNSSDGLIEIKASQSINLAGTSPEGDISSGIRSETLSIGDSSNISVSGTQLSLQNAARIQAFTFSDANGGNLEIKTSDAIHLNNSFINASTRGRGDAGNINLSTSQLQLTNVGIISSSSIGSNNGNGGEVTINANYIDLSGASNSSRSNISTSSFTIGNAGNLTINTSVLKITDGASISSSSFNEGNAGNLTINASKSINLSGDNQNFQGSTNSESTIRTAVQIGQSSNLPAVPSGNSGSLTINTPSLLVNDRAVITVANQGSGNAGTLTINADNLNLDTSGKITAASESGTGGDIFVNSQNLEIGNDSQITATAENDGDGGNITINTGNLIAKKNAQVTANALKGRGGNITVNTQGLFLADPPERVFNASSEFGLDGTITINSPENSFLQEIEESEIEIVTMPDFFTLRCANPDRAYLSISPRQHLPASPDNYYTYPTQTLSESLITPEFEKKLERLSQELDSIAETETETEIQSTLIWQPGDPMINATEMVTTSDGRVFLVPSQPKLSQKRQCVSFLK